MLREWNHTIHQGNVRYIKNIFHSIDAYEDLYLKTGVTEQSAVKNVIFGCLSNVQHNFWG